MRLRRIAISILVLVFSAVVCQAKAPGVRSEMLVSTDWLAQHLNDPQVVVVHVGVNKYDYAAGHIPGARFLAIAEIAVDRGGIPNELPPVAALKTAFEKLGVGDRTRVVLYGEHQGLLAARAWFTLDYLGHGRNAALLDGGIEKWRAEKRQLSTEAPQAKQAVFTPRVREAALMTLPQIEQVVKEPHARIALIDARPPEQFSGRVAEGVARPGHIPGATNLFWMTTVQSQQNPVLKPEADLRRMFAAAGAKPGSKVIAYCRTGVQASHTYFVAKYLGYDVTLYDGSFMEWSKNPVLPVEK